MDGQPAAAVKDQKRVLIVDDDADLLSVVRIILEHAGYVVDTASGGEECLKKTAEQLPDVIILDVLMPKMNGAQVARSLRSNPKTSSIPIIMLTALNDKKYHRSALFDLGIEFYITKPFNEDDLKDKVHDAIRYRRGR